MRPVTVFAVSFLVSVLIGAMLLPTQPTPRSSPLRRAPAVKAPRFESAANPYVLLPALPSIANVSPDPYETARQMLLKGRLREAQDLYLQILLDSSSIDQRAMQGLARVQGLLAHGDPATLQQQAETYRRTIARTREGTEGYSPRALELLAEANLLAARDIQAAQAPRLAGVSAAPDISGIPRNALPGTAGARGARPALPAIMNEIVRVGSALNPAGASPAVATVDKPGPPPADPEIVVPVPIPSGPVAPAGSAGAQGGAGAGSSSSWGAAPASSGGSGRGGNASSWGSEPAGSSADRQKSKP